MQWVSQNSTIIYFTLQSFAGKRIRHFEAILNKEVQQASARLEILYEDDLTEGDTYGDE
jgi:hypothetical protein